MYFDYSCNLGLTILSVMTKPRLDIFQKISMIDDYYPGFENSIFNNVKNKYGKIKIKTENDQVLIFEKMVHEITSPILKYMDKHCSKKIKKIKRDEEKTAKKFIKHIMEDESSSDESSSE